MRCSNRGIRCNRKPAWRTVRWSQWRRMARNVPIGSMSLSGKDRGLYLLEIIRKSPAVPLRCGLTHRSKSPQSPGGGFHPACHDRRPRSISLSWHLFVLLLRMALLALYRSLQQTCGPLDPPREHRTNRFEFDLLRPPFPHRLNRRREARRGMIHIPAPIQLQFQKKRFRAPCHPPRLFLGNLPRGG